MLNETLTEGGDIRDGYNLTRRMWNRDFVGMYRPVEFSTILHALHFINGPDLRVEIWKFSVELLK